MKKLFVIIGFLGISLFCMPELLAQYFTEEAFIDGIYNETATGIKEPMPLPIIREADVMWKKTIWREIDFNQKMNQGFYYPIVPHENWQNLFTILKNAWKAGEIIAYDANDVLNPTGELNQIIKYTTFEKNTTRIEFNDKLDDQGNRTGERDTVYIPLKSVDVTRCRIKEVWYFDKQRSQMMVRIIAICPVMKETKKDGTISYQSLFWVPYNDETRKLLAKSPFYNRNNSSAQLSYDEVFIKRMFDSYIYREENMYDRNIDKYKQGIEILKESERIKQSIIDYEQQLWEY